MHRQSFNMESAQLLQHLHLTPEQSLPPLRIQRIEAKAGETLIHQGDSCDYFLYVEKGLIKVEKMASSGQEIVLYHLRPGQACELATACLLAGNHYPAVAQAEQDSEVLLIGKTEFLKLFHGNREFQQYIYHDLDNTTSQLLNLLEDIVAIPMEQRLSRFLYQHCLEKNPVATTHHQIATELGSAREVVSRLLKKFEQRNWIQRSRGLIWVSDPEALKSLANNNSG